MSTVTSEDFTFFADFLRQRSAISLGPGKEYLVESRLAPIARSGGYADVAAVIRELRRPVPDRALRDQIVDAMTTNETSFFRDVHPFDALRTDLVPERMKANAAARTLSIWSAASSTGQELYTISMVLDTHFPQLADWKVDLVGTDLSAEAVGKARRGQYSQFEVNRGLPATMLVRYFERSGRDFTIASCLRDRCRFEQMNLAEAWPLLPRFDIVFCRNVLIYFDVPVRERILSKIRAALNPGGLLVLSAAETTLGAVSGFEKDRVGKTLIYRAEQ